MLYVKSAAFGFVKVDPGVIFKVNVLKVATVTVVKFVEALLVRALLPNFTLFKESPC